MMAGPVKSTSSLMKYVAPACILILTSCTTTYLWNETDPYVLVSQKDITEQELHARKLKYVRDDEFGVFFVQKKGLERYTDYAIRIVGTPVTVAVDTTTFVVVVGGGFYLAAYANDADAFDFIAGMMELMADATPARNPQPTAPVTNKLNTLANP